MIYPIFLISPICYLFIVEWKIDASELLDVAEEGKSFGLGEENYPEQYIEDGKLNNLCLFLLISLFVYRKREEESASNVDVGMSEAVLLFLLHDCNDADRHGVAGALSQSSISHYVRSGRLYRLSSLTPSSHSLISSFPIFILLLNSIQFNSSHSTHRHHVSLPYLCIRNKCIFNQG